MMSRFTILGLFVIAFKRKQTNKKGQRGCFNGLPDLGYWLGTRKTHKFEIRGGKSWRVSSWISRFKNCRNWLVLSARAARAVVSYVVTIYYCNMQIGTPVW